MATKESSPRDDLAEYIAEREEREPGFADLVVMAEKRQAFARQLAECRRASGQSQTQVAASMETSASIVSRLESGMDVRISTLEKYVDAIGMDLAFRAVPREQARGSTRKRATKRRSGFARTATKSPRRASKRSGGKKSR